MTSGSGSSTGVPQGCHPILAEVLYDPQGGEDERQWVKLYNPCAEDFDLDGYSLGWGGDDYTFGGLDLQGVLWAQECYVVGGPLADGGNGDPFFDLGVDFEPDLLRSGGLNSGGPADGVALFDAVEADVMPNTIPVDAVIYGDDNDDNLLDAEGSTPPPHVGDASSGDSIRRLDPTIWIIEPDPMPNVCPPF